MEGWEFEFHDSSIVEPIEIRMIRPSKFPIRHLSENSPDFENLKHSIKEHGLLQPIVIRPREYGFEIVAGHRRFSACKSLRWRFIPSKIREFSDKEAYEIQLTENIQRKTMDPIEEAEAYHRYVVDFGWGGISDLAKKIGKSEEYVSHRMQLLKLSQIIKQKITSNSLSVSQALELTNLDPEKYEEFSNDIISNNLTVRQIRRMKQKLQQEQSSVSNRYHKKESILKKSNLALKITLTRLDDLIEQAHKTSPTERAELVRFLMALRLKVHSMIDDTIKFNNKR